MPNENNSFNISVTFRHTDSTEALKKYAQEKLLHCLKKYIKQHADVQIILDVEKRDHIAEVNVASKDFDTTAKATTDDLYSAIDKVVHTIDIQLRRQKGKLVEQKHASLPV
jgi:putative sigma-54 modulation protein